MWKCSASSGSIPSVGSAAPPAPIVAAAPFASKWAISRSSASSRRLSTRSSASSRSVSRISPYGVMWFGLTIARSSPASTQWCRNTLLITLARRQPDAERDVRDAERGLDARDLRLDQADPLDRLDRRRPPLLVAGRERERQAVEDQRLAVEPVLVAAELGDPLRDLELALAPSSPSRPRRSSARSARRRARGRAAATRSSLARPASRLTELTIARPGICSSAVSITSGSVESIWIGAGWVSEIRLTSRRICSASSWRSVSATQTSSTCAPPCDLILGDHHEPVVVVREQQLLGLARALRVDALADERRSRVLDERCRRDHRAHVRRPAGGPAARRRPRDALRERRDVRRRRAAAAADDPDAVALDELAEHRRRAARAARGRSSRRSGPAAAGRRSGCSATGTGQYSPRKRIASRMSSGPVEQLSPITSTAQRLERRQHGADVGPEQHLAAVRQQRDAALDRHRAALELERLAGAEDRRLDLEDVLRGLDDDQVAAAADESLRLLGEHRHQLAEA